jgi:hypothetical protein
MTDEDKRSAASKVMGEAIDLAIAEESPYPEESAFIDADTPFTEHQIEKAFGDGFAAVVVSADGRTRILQPESS